MRVDLFLKTSRLIKSRSIAQDFCDAGLVEVNGAIAKSSKEVKPGDTFLIKRRNRTTLYEVRSVPAQKQISKEKAPELYRIVSEVETPDR